MASTQLAWPAMISVDVDLALGPIDLRLKLETKVRRIAITGPSGFGKSTFLRVLLGLEPTASGEVKLDGQQLQGPGLFVPAWERELGWVPQSSLLFPHLTVRKNLGYAGASPAEVSRVSKLLEIDTLLERRPKRLSGGEAQRVALGRALLSNARAFLLDEPFTGLDPALLKRLAPRLLSEVGERMLLLVTHDPRSQELFTEERWCFVVDPIQENRRLLRLG